MLCFIQSSLQHQTWGSWVLGSDLQKPRTLPASLPLLAATLTHSALGWFPPAPVCSSVFLLAPDSPQTSAPHRPSRTCLVSGSWQFCIWSEGPTAHQTLSVCFYIRITLGLGCFLDTLDFNQIS